MGLRQLTVCQSPRSAAPERTDIQEAVQERKSPPGRGAFMRRVEELRQQYLEGTLYIDEYEVARRILMRVLEA